MVTLLCKSLRNLLFPSTDIHFFEDIIVPQSKLPPNILITSKFIQLRRNGISEQIVKLVETNGLELLRKLFLDVKMKEKV